MCKGREISKKQPPVLGSTRGGCWVGFGAVGPKSPVWAASSPRDECARGVAGAGFRAAGPVSPVWAAYSSSLEEWGSRASAEALSAKSNSPFSAPERGLLELALEPWGQSHLFGLRARRVKSVQGQRIYRQKATPQSRLDKEGLLERALEPRGQCHLFGLRTHRLQKLYQQKATPPSQLENGGLL